MVDSQVLANLFAAAYDGNLAMVKSIVKDGKVPVDTADASQGSTALQWACYGGSLEVVEWLVKDAGAKVGHKNKDDRNALFFACEHCHKPVAAFLVGRDADVNCRDQSSGHAPLHRACIAGQTRDQAGATELITWLLTSAGADPEVKDLSGQRPGEADLSMEAPQLKPSQCADKIRRMLEDARGGNVPNGTTPIPPAAPPSPAPAPVRSSPPRASSPVGAPAPAPAPSRVASRAAALAAANSAKPAVADVPPPEPVALPGTSRGVSRVAARAAALAASTGGTAKTSIDPNTWSSPIAAAKDDKPAVASTERSAPAPPSDSRPSWVKPRAGGVLPRTGGTLPVTANAAPVGSPAGVTAAAAAAVNSSSSAKPSSTSRIPSTKTGAPTPAPAADPGPRLLRRSAAALAATVATPAPTPVAAPAPAPAPAPVTKVTPAAAASSPLARYQRSAAGSTSGPAALRAPASPPAKGAAHAVIAASNAPKASALAAAFENKARGRQSPPPPRRGDSGLSASARAKKAPTLVSVSSGSSTGSAGNGSAATKTSPAPAPEAPFVTPQELLGTGSVMKKKQVYVAAAQKTSNAAVNGSSKSVPTPSLGKGKKKESSFMDKFVQMFSISPQSSRESSPTRSSSRSPNRSTSRSPHRLNGAQHTADDAPRMGFFNSNLSFKEKE